ncbi:MAG TPA: hypothetical protein VD860_18280 [Azospirillum sp.]|nr:hypothetical protein [Azospirillum sp.]
MLLRPAVLSVCLALAACGERVVADEPSPAYTLAEVAYAASNRDLRVVVQGNPFGGDPQAFGQVVTGMMQNRIMGVDTNFTTTPGPSARPDYRVVLAFNVARNELNSALCANPALPTKPPGGPIIVQGAFCRGGGPLSSATGWLDQPKSVQDPAFRDLIADMTYSLFPTRRADSGCSGPDC